MHNVTSTATAVTGSTVVAAVAVALALAPTAGRSAEPTPNTASAKISAMTAQPADPLQPRPVRPEWGHAPHRTPAQLGRLNRTLGTLGREGTAAAPGAVQAEGTARQVTLSAGTGQLIRLPRPIAGMFIADDHIADVQVKSPTQLYLFAKTAGETSIYATDRAGGVVWSAAVRVGNNLAGVAGMLHLALPEAAIGVTPVGNMVMLSGTVLSPKDIDEAQRLTDLFTAGSTPVINRLRTATPQQVSLHVKIVEVSRSAARDIGVNLLAQDTTRGLLFGGSQGNPGTIDPTTGKVTFSQLAGTTLAFAGHAYGLNLLSTLQLYENNGFATTLAEPNLLAISGETASFLAGGEIPVPQSQGLGAVSVEFKQYGVSLAFTPVVLSDGRISIKVRPEVSQLSDSGSVKLNGFTIPALVTRRAETTVELGSGQSFVIGGLLQNDHNNTISRAPFLGDLPILGSLFRSNSFRKSESELMIVITPYLVKPVDAGKIALPTDGYKAPPVLDRVLGGQLYDGTSGARRPMPAAAGEPAPTAPSARAKQ